MPRKAKKSDKPPLLFLESPSRGAKVQNEPEVRAALNPKPFFTESHNNTTLNSWVSQQFDPSVAAAPPVRRGRRRCHRSATSVLDRSSQLTRKTSVCRYPSLSFETTSRERPRQTRREVKVKVKSTASRTSGRTASVGERDVEQVGVSGGAASSSRCLDPPETSSIVVMERCKTPEPAASTPPVTELRTPDVSDVCTPLDVDTPNVLHEGNSCPSSPFLRLLMPRSPPSTPQQNRPPDTSVADTPERDYGVKVTWRRRRSLMSLLKERGLLSDSDVLIHG